MTILRNFTNKNVLIKISVDGKCIYLTVKTIEKTLQQNFLADQRVQAQKITDFEAQARAKILHNIFGFACDISSDGTRYQITQKPICPTCGKCEIKHWGPTNPPEFVEMDVKSITHEAWNKLQWKEKQDVVNDALNNFFNQAK